MAVACAEALAVFLVGVLTVIVLVDHRHASRAESPAALVTPSVSQPRAPNQQAAFKRRQTLTAEELRRQLLLAPEVGLDADACQSIVQMARNNLDGPWHSTLDVIAQKPELGGLPLLKDGDCQIGKDAAGALEGLSRKLRVLMANAVHGKRLDQDRLDPRINPQTLFRLLDLRGKFDPILATINHPDAVVIAPGSVQPSGAPIPPPKRNEWLEAEAVAPITQVLMTEDKPVRMLLVALLGQNPSREATLALANRAVFDLSPEVREAAVSALMSRGGADQARPVFLQGLRYPWPPAAEHAAEALVNLADVDSIPDLVRLLALPSPSAPANTGGSRDAGPVVREVVRVNHLRNCVMCHAPSVSSEDPVRGLVPTPGQPVPPTFQPLYNSRSEGLFVRADVTYLRQEFSVPQPVASPNNWPAFQRYDYLVRTRPATVAEKMAQAKRKDTSCYPQREAVLFALRELTAQEARSKTEA